MQASTGAISGAIKMLTSVGLVERVPAPASRRDHYRLRDDAWAVLYTNQNEVLAAMQKAAEAGIAATGTKSLARHRLTQMRDFYDFLLGEIPALLDRWRAVDGYGEVGTRRAALPVTVDIMIVERQNIIDAPSGRVWERIVTPEGINDELRPWMTHVDAARRGSVDRRTTSPVGTAGGRCLDATVRRVPSTTTT